MEQAKEEIRLSIIEYRTTRLEEIKDLKGYKKWIEEAKNNKINEQTVIIEIDNDENPSKVIVKYKKYEIELEDNLDIKTTTVGKDEEKDKEQISRDIPDVISYVQDGLIMYYDGINNTGNGHSNTTTKWKDLSGNNNDGTINGSVWEENSLNFDGIDDWVNCGEMNYSNVTIEAVVLYKNVPNG